MSEKVFVLVKIRCKVDNCGGLLDNVISAPAETDEERWSWWVRVQICQRHGEGAGRGEVRKWQERQRRHGKPTDRVRTHTWIPWADLRPFVVTARRKRKTQVYLLSP
jgi:hypothetical protein